MVPEVAGSSPVVHPIPCHGPLSVVSNTLAVMLTHDDIELLEFEQAHPRRTGLKDDAILHRLRISPARYYSRLAQLVRRPVVRDRYPRLADRVARQADRRREVRASFDRYR